MTSTPPPTPDHADSLWRDPTRTLSERADALLDALTLDEKVAQLYGVWIAASTDGAEVAPHQHDMNSVIDLDALLPSGLGQLTRPFGTRPVDAAIAALSLARTQQRIVAESRLGIPAIAHDECLAGFSAWGATAYPVPLAWGATFDPELVRELGSHIGADMRSVGVHQGLAPVLDVVRDARWGRVEETIGEDPYLVATIATAYVDGLEGAGIVSTLKHFVGYSASRAGRNLAPVSVGMRELQDVLLPPFEMAVREGGARSVMNSYSDIDGVPSAADDWLLTSLLRDQWGFDGTVVADYFAIDFLHRLHRTAGSVQDAGVQALRAGIDVELPTVHCYGDELVKAVHDGIIPEDLVDRAARRVLRQKIGLGLMDPEYDPLPSVLRSAALVAEAAEKKAVEEVRGTVDLDGPSNRDLARRIAERSIILLSNDGTLPLSRPSRIALIGPNSDDPYAVLGCYSFPTHVGTQHPEVPLGIALPTLRESLAREFPDALITHVPGTSVDGGETDGIRAAVAAAEQADIVILALGDRAGLFGRGTSGEGCDVPDLALPGAQGTLADAILTTGTPTVIALLAGRPYALGNLASRASAVLEAFFAGEEGTPALAGVLSGRVNPSGRLPVSVPAHSGAQPSTYLAAPLAQRTAISSIDPTPAFWFGHGLSYTTTEWSLATCSGSEFEDTVTVGITVQNTGSRTGHELIQLYLADPVATVVRPVRRLIGYVSVELEPAKAVRAEFVVHADLSSFTGLDGRRRVEPGSLRFEFGRSAGQIEATVDTAITGPVRLVDHTRVLRPDITVIDIE